MLDKLLQLLSYNPQEPLLFNTSLFCFLFAAFVIGYALLSNHRTTLLRLAYVTLFSYYFYYKNAGGYCILLLIITIVNFFSAIFIDRSNIRWVRRFWLTLAVVFMVGQLAFFKYTNFLLSSWADISGQGEPMVLDIFLPLGISFFTFQSLSYIIDVYRRDMPATYRFLDFAFFVSFFPTLLSGPILRARQFLPQLRKPLLVTREMFGTGLWFIIMGLIKKGVISDFIGENFVNRIFDNPALYTGLENLMAVYGYALKLYCDFSGYSDIAIGIALWLGFTIPDNFNTPYQSTSVTEFWRRWHISLSTWLRDYLYIPLGGNRKGKMRMYFNQMMTMLIGGLWHGASWNFVIWGGIHGTALCTHKAWRDMLHHDKHYVSHGIRKFFAILITFHVVCLAWIFFANTSFEYAWIMLQKIFTDFHGELFMGFLEGYPIVTAIMVAGFILHFLPASVNQWAIRTTVRTPLILQVLLFVLTVFILMQVRGSEVQPFIYLQF